MKVLLVGIVTREMAQSAVAAGYEVISLDYFGDSDLPVSAEVYSLTRDFSFEPELKNLIAAAKTLAGWVDRIIVGAGLENESGLYDLGKPETYWTNSSVSVQKVRDPLVLSNILRGTSMRFPKTFIPGDRLPTSGKWLVKDSRHSGGLGVRDWDGETALQEYEILQEKIEGKLMSACFLANRDRAIVLGLSRQFSGVPELGAPAFAWCGNMAPYKDSALEKELSEIVVGLTETTGLAGVNGMDFILRDDATYLLEVNPRWTGSLELFERLYGLNMFQLHVEACLGRLPGSLTALPFQPVVGKGVPYAREDITLGDTSGWRKRGMADVPHSGETIPAGTPICTVFADGKDMNECWEEIIQKAKALMGQRANKGIIPE